MLHLGIDIGTTKVSLVLVSGDRSFHQSVSMDHKAAISNQDVLAEQDFGKVEETCRALLSKFPKELLCEVVSIGFTTQMHTILLGKNTGEVSPMVTWQDRRTTNEVDDYFANSGRKLMPGFGMATLAHFARRGQLDGWDYATTPAGEMAKRLVGQDAVRVICPTLAASWGLYNLDSNSWDFGAAEKLSIPRRFFPQITKVGSVVGVTKSEFFSIPARTRVFLPIGDNQASILGSGGDLCNDVFVTIGTGSQLSVVVPMSECKERSFMPGVEVRPFSDNSVLLAVPPLSGGRAITILAEAVNSFLVDLGLQPIEDGKLLERLNDLALSEKGLTDNGGLRFTPDFYGSRVNPECFASIKGITDANFRLPKIAAALFAGVVSNLVSPFPMDILSKRKRIIGSGNGLGKSKAMQAALHEALSLPMVMADVSEEAATGAALIYRMVDL